MKAQFKASVVSTGTNYAHQIHAGHFDLVTDEPAALGGQGQGPAPYDYYLAALASCTAITLRMYSMPFEARIAAIVVGSLLGVLIWHVYADYRVQQAQRDAWAAVQAAARDPDPMGLVALQQRQLQAQRLATDREQARYRLALNQRCVGGVVVQVDGSSYTQLGTIASPVHCAGDRADRPIR